MSTTTQTFPARERRVSIAVVVAIVASLTLGAAGGSVITRAVDPVWRPAVPATAVWDSQKLGAIQGRLVAAALAEREISAWDPAKLAAMQGRQRAEAIRLAGSDP